MGWRGEIGFELELRAPMAGDNGGLGGSG